MLSSPGHPTDSTISLGEDPLAVLVANPDADAPVLIVCDHASNRVPAGMGNLGLPPEELARHIAWDIGAAKVARWLAGRLGATAVLSGVSRLVIDCNRPVGHATSICAESDGTLVPGNQGLGDAARASRINAYFRPYHSAIGAQLHRLEAGRRTAALIAIHSFTPVMAGRARPWRAGVLWNRDPRLASPLIEILRDRHNLCVGDNEPYSGRTCNYTVDTHGGAHGRPHVSIEIRQDEIADDQGALCWAERLSVELPALLAHPDNRQRRVYP